MKYALVLIISSGSLFGQRSDSLQTTKRNFDYALPEIKYGGVIKNNVYHSQLYAAYYVLGHCFKETSDGRESQISGGISYTRMFTLDYLSIFPYVGRNGWYGTHVGLKAEPLFNIQKLQFEYTNVELTFGWLLSLSLTAGIPNNFKRNFPYYGFKVGYAFPYPLLKK
ncbi:MAG: hypothetical protein V4580_17560 [Bacteroidota bacterium]